MTPAQLATLKTAILADPALVAIGRNDTEMARVLNLPTTFMVWRSTTPADDVIDAILWDRLTPIDTPDGTAAQNGRELRCQTKQMNLQIILQGRENIATGRPNLRAGLTDALTNVPSGVNGATQDAGWLGAGRVKTVITRAATAVEKVFATGTGTLGAPGALVFEGTITVADIGEMWNLE